MALDRDIHGEWLTCITCAFQLNVDGSYIDRSDPDEKRPPRSRRRGAKLRGSGVS